MAFRINKKKLNILLAKRCMGYKDLISLTELSSSSIYKATSGQKISPKTAGLIARALQCEVEALLDDSE